MTLQEKKQVIIDHIQNETSEIIIDRMTIDYNNIKSWNYEYVQDILRLCYKNRNKKHVWGKRFIRKRQGHV